MPNQKEKVKKKSGNYNILDISESGTFYNVLIYCALHFKTKAFGKLYYSATSNWSLLLNFTEGIPPTSMP